MEVGRRQSGLVPACSDGEETMAKKSKTRFVAGGRLTLGGNVYYRGQPVPEQLVMGLSWSKRQTFLDTELLVEVA